VRTLEWSIAIVATIVGVALVLVAVRLAGGAQNEARTVIAESMPRPSFALDARRQGDPARIGHRSVLHIAAEDGDFMRALVERAATRFDVPLHLLESEVQHAMLSHDDGSGFVLAPLGSRIIMDLNVPPDLPTAEAARTLVEFLGHDPRPFDAFLSREIELGVGARAASLAAARVALERRIRSLGIAPGEETVWFLALLSVRYDTGELAACMETALAMDPSRLGRAFADLAPTLRLLGDRSFVLRAFLDQWAEHEARRRSVEFVRNVEKTARSYRATAAAGSSGGTDALGG
jgi:hypothetical protein